MRIAALTTGPNVPSSRFRVRQHFSQLRQSGIEVVDYFPSFGGRTLRPTFLRSVRGRYLAPVFATELMLNLIQRIPGVIGSHRSDLTWLERNFLPMLDDLSVVLRRPMVIDVDDAIWLYNIFGERSVGRLMRRADAVIAGNSFLADWCARFCKAVHIVPTAIDTDRFAPASRTANPVRSFTIGWTGTASNFAYLQQIEAALAAFLKSFRAARFLIVADREPTFSQIPYRSLEYHRWSPENEHLLVQQMDVGLMPLPDSDIARGKCSFKMLQYMACGIPVVVSPVGMNSEILARSKVGVAARTRDEWTGAIEAYALNPSLRALHGRAGRETVLQEFDTKVVGAELLRIFRSVV